MQRKKIREKILTSSAALLSLRSCSFAIVWCKHQAVPRSNWRAARYSVFCPDIRSMSSVSFIMFLSLRGRKSSLISEASPGLPVSLVSNFWTGFCAHPHLKWVYPRIGTAQSHFQVVFLEVQNSIFCDQWVLNPTFQYSMDPHTSNFFRRLPTELLYRWEFLHRSRLQRHP